MTGTDWLTAIGILLSGAVIGFMFLYATTRKKSTPEAGAAPLSAAARPVEVRDLEAKRDGLIAHLRELADMGGNEEEIARLEQEAANVLRQLDGIAVVTAKGERVAASGERGAKAAARDPRPAAGEQRPASAEQRPTSALKGFLWGVGSAAAIAGLVFFVVDQAKSRESGGSVTGGATMGGQSAAQPMQQAQGPGQSNGQPDPELQKLEAAVQATPDDIDARDNLAHAYLERENMVAAFEQAQTVLTKAPADPRANTVQAIVRIAMGESEQASKQLEAATKTDPKLTDAWVALAWAYTQSGRDADADTAINSAVKENPDQEVRLREVLGKMRQQAKIQPAATKHPAVGGGADSAEMPATARASTPSGDEGKGVKVTLSLSSGAKPPASAVLFVIVRAAGQTSGPPVAVKRLAGSSFPLTVEVTAADSMMGQPLPANMRIEARLDSDGNPLTKEPTDLDAVKDGVVAGGSVVLALH
jgi:tetratricopeptide (TPR) repeat protein